MIFTFLELWLIIFCVMQFIDARRENLTTKFNLTGSFVVGIVATLGLYSGGI